MRGPQKKLRIPISLNSPPETEFGTFRGDDFSVVNSNEMYDCSKKLKSVYVFRQGQADYNKKKNNVLRNVFGERSLSTMA